MIRPEALPQDASTGRTGDRTLIAPLKVGVRSPNRIRGGSDSVPGKGPGCPPEDLRPQEPPR